MRRMLAIAIMGAMIVGCGASPTATSPSASAAATSATDAVRWAQFAIWARGDLQTAAVALDTLNERTTAGDGNGAMDAGRALERSASSQLQYLSSHPPAQCYANIHALIVTGMTHMKNMGSAAAAADRTTQLAEKDLGYPALTEAAKLIPAADAVCTQGIEAAQ